MAPLATQLSPLEMRTPASGAEGDGSDGSGGGGEGTDGGGE